MKDLHKLKGILCSQTGRLNIVEMAIPTKQSVDSMQSPSKLQWLFFCINGEADPKIHVELK